MNFTPIQARSVPGRVLLAEIACNLLFSMKLKMYSGVEPFVPHFPVSGTFPPIIGTFRTKPKLNLINAA